VLRHRGLVVAALLAAAALAALAVLRPPTPPTVEVAVAGRDLAPGGQLAPADVAVARLHPAVVPAGTYGLAEVPHDRLLAGAVRRGEPLTDAAFIGPGAADVLAPDDVLAAVAVRAPVTQLVRPGDVVQLVVSDPRAAAPATVVAESATVVAVPDSAETSTTGPHTLVVAVPQSAALMLSAAASTMVIDALVPSTADG
jgi:Flp pilus assembly protein CpaB